MLERKKENPKRKKDVSYTPGHSGNQTLLDSEV